MTNIRICTAAEGEFTDALCWYAERSVDVAKAFESEIDQTLRMIAATP
jgi:plasmid stabilization system protein ParE